MTSVLMLTILLSCTKNNLAESIRNDESLAMNERESLNVLASPVGDVVGKVTVGYQGWFTAAGDNSPQNSWGHQNLESWPDVREYSKTYHTPLSNLGSGQPAKMFSSWDASTVNKHFQWMQQYEIDCAALQRFCNEITPGNPIKAFRDGMATKIYLYTTKK